MPVLSVIQGGLAADRVESAPRPGFGRLLWLGATDGTHRLGSARAVRSMRDPVWGLRGPMTADGMQLDGLIRLSEHYGTWLGFQGTPRARAVGQVRFLAPVPLGAERMEFRIHIRRIQRRREMLVADGEALCDGLPVLRAEAIEVGA